MAAIISAFGHEPRVLRSLTGDLRQLASVRKIVVDEGVERGVAALAFSTGGGLDFEVVIDRSLDIGALSWRGSPVAWRSPTGMMHPALIDRDAESGRGFERALSGMLVTCGLDHIRQPRDGHPLHGRLPFTPARLLAYGEDWERDVPTLFCEGEVRQWRIGGESLRLIRRIEAPIGSARFIIKDRVSNLAASNASHALLYHFNLGFPAIGPGTVVRLDGDILIGPIAMPDAAQTTAFTTRCRRESALCEVVTPRDGADFVIAWRFATSSLTHLQLWRDLRPGAAVLSVEPCTSARPSDDAASDEPPLSPGETRSYEIALSFEDWPHEGKESSSAVRLH